MPTILSFVVDYEQHRPWKIIYHYIFLFTRKTTKPHMWQRLSQCEVETPVKFNCPDD